jgi:hypothetical protein
MIEAVGLCLNRELVILSSCNSAVENGKGGEGFAGIAKENDSPIDGNATEEVVDDHEK